MYRLRESLVTRRLQEAKVKPENLAMMAAEDYRVIQENLN